MNGNLRAILDSLFISKVRVKILRLFYSNPEDQYHIRGVVREITEEINAVRRELLRLQEIGLLNSEKKGNRIYFALRKDFVLYEDLLSIVHKTHGLGEEVLQSLDKLGSISYAILTRSYLMGERSSNGDIDLLLIGQVDLDVLSSLVQRAERQIGRDINYTVFKDSEFNLRKKRRDPLLLSMILGKKIVLFGDEDELVS